MKHVVCALLTLAALACGDGKKEEGPTEPDDAGTSQSDAGTGELGTVQGRVTYADGVAVGQVKVRVGNKMVQTDSRGVFAVDDVPKGNCKVSVEEAYATAAQVNTKVEAQKSTQVDLSVIPMQKVSVASVDAAGTITHTADGVTVTVTVGEKSFHTKNGDPAMGTGEMSYGVVKQSNDMAAAPGDMKVKMADGVGSLESFGMIDLRFSQGGEPLELVKALDIDLPLGPNALASGALIDVFSFDPVESVWKPEGQATVDKSAGGNGVAKVKASHLSWWCVGMPVTAPSCLSGKLLTAAEAPLAGMLVSAVGVDYWGTASALTAADGTFCLDVKGGSNNTVRAFGTTGTSYFEWKQDVIAAGAASCGAGTCTDVGSLMGESLFDECAGDVSTDQNHALVLSSGDAALDAAVKAALESHDHTVTVGAAFTAFDGTLDLAPYDVIYLQANANWSSGDMPVAGQRQLINWVNCGGGLATAEWTTWKIGSSGFQLIDAIFPAARTTAYGSPAMETYTVVTPEPTINAGLPDSFTFSTTNFSGTESNLNPRPGAVIYYDSMMLDSGLLGWQYNLGRVASFSTTVGANEIADANFSRLLANVLDWLQRDTP